MDDAHDRVDSGQVRVQGVDGVDIELSTHLSIRDAADRANVTEKTIRRWIHSGRLMAEKLGGQYRIAPADLDLARVDMCGADVSTRSSTQGTLAGSSVRTSQVDIEDATVAGSSAVDLRPLVEHIAALEDRVQQLTEAATIWQVRAGQLEEQLKQLTAGDPVVADDDAPDRGQEAPGGAEVVSMAPDAPRSHVAVLIARLLGRGRP